MHQIGGADPLLTGRIEEQTSLSMNRFLPTLIEPALPFRPTYERRLNSSGPLVAPLVAPKPDSSRKKLFRPPPRSSLPLKPIMLVPHWLLAARTCVPVLPLAWCTLLCTSMPATTRP